MAQQNLRARQQQRQRFIIILVVLALVGAGVFFFLNGSKATSKKAVKPRPKGQVAVPIAKKDIPLGTRISRKEFTVKFLKPNDVPTDAILSVDEFLGRFVTRPLLEGQYIKQGDVGGEGAAGGFSAMAKPGRRLISLPANLFPGSLETLKVGDRIDLLAFEGTSVGPGGGRKGKGLADNATTLQGGGSQPGDRNSQARQNARARRAAGSGFNPYATNATLIAENAEIMSVPPISKRRARRAANDFLVLQMGPQDAHITTLMVATGTMMRAVFRPFGDDTRLTQDEPAKITTRFPRSVADPDGIMIIAGGATYIQRPNNKLFINETERRNMAEDSQPAMSGYAQQNATSDTMNSSPNPSQNNRSARQQNANEMIENQPQAQNINLQKNSMAANQGEVIQEDDDDVYY